MSFRYPKGGFIQLFFDPLTPGPANAFGPMYSWGRNDEASNGGQLAQNNVINRSSPVQVGSLANWKYISLSNNNTGSAIKTDGTLWTWGSTVDGRAGLNVGGLNPRSSPVQVGTLTNWSVVSIRENALAVKTDGTLWAWGNGNGGAVGDNTDISRSSPVQIGAGTNWLSVSAGNRSSLALKTDGTMWSWGKNTYGELGLNDIVSRSSPVQIGSLNTWQTISASQTGSFAAIKTDGTLWLWGRNNYGQLGLDDKIARSSPVQLGALTNWSKVSLSSFGGLSIKTDGTLWTWGNNSTGILGQNNTISRSSPVQIGALNTWLIAAGGYYHAVALSTSGTLWSWGKNNYGQLGQNISYTVNRSSPVQVGADTNWTSISLLLDSSIAIQGS